MLSTIDTHLGGALQLTSAHTVQTIGTAWLHAEVVQAVSHALPVVLTAGTTDTLGIVSIWLMLYLLEQQ